MVLMKEVGRVAEEHGQPEECGLRQNILLIKVEAFVFSLTQDLSRNCSLQASRFFIQSLSRKCSRIWNIFDLPKKVVLLFQLMGIGHVELEL